MSCRVYTQARLNTHYESYLRVLSNDETRFVPGDGNVLSPVVFIGEAPGEQEERLGKPFIGRSGNLLSKLLATVDLTRRDVFITNLVKHRPPNNADPKPEQVVQAALMMDLELTILKPRVVVPLGRFATSVFWTNPIMGLLHGFAKEKKLVGGYKTLVLPMYHPAAALRSSSVRTMLYDDFQKLKPHLGREPH